MRTFVIVFAVYFVPAVAVLTFAWAMDKWLDRYFNKEAEKRRVGLTNR